MPSTLRFKGDKPKSAGVKKTKKKPKPEEPRSAKEAALVDALKQDVATAEPESDVNVSQGPKRPGVSPSADAPPRRDTESAEAEAEAAPHATTDATGPIETTTTAQAKPSEPAWMQGLTEAQKRHERHRMRQVRVPASPLAPLSSP